MEIDELVEDYVSGGCTDYSDRLGFCDVPMGYALLLNRDESHFFYIKEDGKESSIHWDKWAVYNWIKADNLKTNTN